MDIESKTLSTFPNYIIYRDGRVYNSKTRRFLKGSVGNQGYISLDLKTDLDTRSVQLLHRLLALCFSPTEDTFLLINHKDGNKLNNSIDNLEWCSYKENYDHSIATGLQVKTRPVVCITTNEKFNSAKEAAELLKISRPNISNCCAGRRLSAGKTPDNKPRVWRFEDEL